jgi:hypothetical protein
MKNALPALLLASYLLCGFMKAAEGTNIPRSPENHIYQFMTEQTNLIPPFKAPTNADAGFLFAPQTATAYLWVPPACTKLRGVVIMGANVPEQWFGGHPGFRSVCAEEGLAILFSCPSARLNAVDKADPKILSNEEKCRLNVAFHQKILDALAQGSGYPELSTVPWLPIGESMSLLLVSHLTQGAPERCIAGIWVKDAPFGNATESVPMLAACGTGAEWDFPKLDAFERWREMAANDWKDCLARRAALPGWPVSLLIEAGSAHFSVTDPMERLIEQYIRAACKARLSLDGSPTLRPVDLMSGYVAGLPVPAATPLKPKPYADCTAEEKNLPWYFDKECAQAAYDMADVNWNAKTQIAAFSDPDGKPIPYNSRGIVDIKPVMEADGITFTVKSAFLEKVPEGCVKAGNSLTHADVIPAVEWLRGPVILLGGNRFQLALDRSANLAGGEQNPFLRTIALGDRDHRLCVCPAQIHIPVNKTGKPQTITFDPIPDQHAGTKEITLHATSDTGLPVRFFVKTGPAVIKGDKLLFKDVPQGGVTTIPVTVVAWQWGNASVQTAPAVEQSFHLLK